MEVRDLVERLRGDGSSWAQPMFDEAAAEIERLRAVLEEFARQKTEDEMSEEEYDTADGWGAYEMFILRARDALKAPAVQPSVTTDSRAAVYLEHQADEIERLQAESAGMRAANDQLLAALKAARGLIDRAIDD